jgi:hypothetical protein
MTIYADEVKSGKNRLDRYNRIWEALEVNEKSFRLIPIEDRACVATIALSVIGATWAAVGRAELNAYPYIIGPPTLMALLFWIRSCRHGKKGKDPP